MRDAESRFANSTQAGARAWRRLPVVAVLLAIASLTVAASSASAAYNHVPGVEFGFNGGSAAFPCCAQSLAYQQASNRLYVANGSKVYGFDVSTPGTFTPLNAPYPFNATIYGYGEIGVDNSLTASAGNIYAAQDSQSVYGFDSSGTPLAGWPVNIPNYSCGVTADSEGHVWASTEGPPGGVEFNPTGGASIASFPRNPSVASGSCEIAIDSSSGDIYTSAYTESATTQVFRYFKATNYTTSEKILNNPFAKAPIAINGVNHRLYVGSESTAEILAISTITGNVVETIPMALPARSIAVDEADDTLYVTHPYTTSKVQVFPALGGPKATTGAPNSPKSTTVNGVADPNSNGPITECHFEFGKSASTMSTTPCDQSLPINSSTPVTATLPGVEGEHIYAYRLIVSNGEPGAVAAGVQKPLLLHNVEGVVNDPASEVKRNSAKMNAHFEGTNEATTYYFEYGPTKAYGSRFPTGVTELSAGMTTGNTAISAVVPGLTAQTKYHYRVVAKNPKGTTVSSGDIEFETPPAVGSISTDEASEITQTTATLNGSYDGSTMDSISDPPESYDYYFEWGTSTTYGNDTAVPPGVDNGIQSGITRVSAEISGLTKYVPTTPTPYHYRIVVSNIHGTTYGPDRIFHSAPSDPPGISEVATSGVSTTEGTVSANVNPNGAPTTYVVEYGTDSSYGTTTLEGDSIGEDETGHPVSATLEGLSPGTTYHYRVVATNFGGTSHSPDRAFTTPAAPGIESSDASQVGETTAHLNALVAAHLSPTVVSFQYGPANVYGGSTVSAPIGSDSLAHNVGADIGGLTPGTTYHFRAVAANGIGTTFGREVTFTTQPAPREEQKRTPPCPKGKVRRHGKCVKRHRKAHRKHAGGKHNA